MPPLVPLAVKVMLVPLQIVVALAVMLIVGVTDGLTVTTSELLVLGSIAHIWLHVMMHFMVSLLAKVVVVKVAPVATFTPFFFP